MTSLSACLFLCVVALGGASAHAAGKADGRLETRVKPAVKTVRQADGSVMERLVLPASKGPAASEEWLQRMTDPTRNGLACKDPQAFQEWMDSVTEPRFMTALASMALEPGVYPQALSRLFDPATAHNWAELTDPELYLRWMGAGMSPQFYAALFNRLTHPDKLGRWAAVPDSPEVRALLASLFDPNMYGKWLRQAVDSRSYAPLSQAANPALPAAWMGGLAQGVSKAITTPSKAQDWLTPDPQANPWLVNGKSYRY
jgi:hypothetical protein